MIYTMNKVSLLTTSDDVNYCIQVYCNRSAPHKTSIGEVLEDSYVGASLDNQKDIYKHLAISLWNQPTTRASNPNQKPKLLASWEVFISNLEYDHSPGPWSSFKQPVEPFIYSIICVNYIKTLIIHVWNSWEDSV